MSDDRQADPIDLDAIRAREQAASLGPWTANRDRIPTDPEILRWPLTLDSGKKAVGSLFVHEEADAEFFRHARQDIPALLALVDRLDRRAAEHEAEFERVVERALNAEAALNVVRDVAREALEENDAMHDDEEGGGE